MPFHYTALPFHINVPIDQHLAIAKMSNASLFNFAKLKGQDNWKQWWRNMEYALTDCGLLTFVNGKSKRPKNTSSSLATAGIQGTPGR